MGEDRLHSERFRLIESDSGYARGVDIVMKFWQFWADAATRDQKK
jgi:hypothetical protein